MQEMAALEAVEPQVRLVAYTARPFELAVATARTCYAKDVVFVGRLGPKAERTRTTLLDAMPGHEDALAVIGDLDTSNEERIRIVEELAPGVEPDVAEALHAFADLARQRGDANARIAHSIYEAGHHTPFQHPTFVFALDGVSRNVVESFFHNHTFYNSEQQSQRYVEMQVPRVHVPAGLSDDARQVYEAACMKAWDAYHDLRGRLVDANHRTMAAIGRIKGQDDQEIRKEAEKKAQEMARYVIPVAAATKLYHTVSGIVLLRYARMTSASSTPLEAKAVVDAMLDAVAEVDPAFLHGTRSAPHEPAAMPEGRLGGQPGPSHPAGTPVLLRATEDAEALVVDAVREVTGGAALSDEELLDQVLDPGVNAVWNDTLNTWDHSPVLRSLRHVHYTFRKGLSLTAYAQDQRHRMTPGTRPQLTTLVGDRSHYTPDIIQADPDALAVYDSALDALYDAIDAIRAEAPPEACTYLLPNAHVITYTQSGDLLSFIHKWRLRLCFNAQKEIFEASLAELRAVQEEHPRLTRAIGPPCSFVAARVPSDQQDSVEACCPEGPRWCGVKVWKNFDAAQGKPKRPY